MLVIRNYFYFIFQKYIILFREKQKKSETHYIKKNYNFIF